MPRQGSTLTPSKYFHCPSSPAPDPGVLTVKRLKFIPLVLCSNQSPLKPDISMPGFLDRQCPSCHRRFPDDSLVLRHMNNPRTSCITWFDLLESTSTSPGQSHHPADRRTSHDNEAGYHGPTHDDEPTRNHHTPTATHYEDIHPNTPFIFGSGPGFMDVFNADHRAEKRRENLYYPFSSKEEWGLASWLLRSGLSMRAIDDFLTLPIVSLETPEKCTICSSLAKN